VNFSLIDPQGDRINPMALLHGMGYQQMVNRLFLVFALMPGSDRVRGQGLELEVSGESKNRYTDLTIL
jgi:hypothetical protein